MAVLVAGGLVGGLVITGVALAPRETDRTSGPAARAVLPVAPASPRPSAVAAPLEDPSEGAATTQVPSTEFVGQTRTITGGLTILSAGDDVPPGGVAAGSSPDAGHAAPWKFVRAELDALLARQETEDLDPLELRAAYETIGCLGAGEFRAFAPGGTVNVRGEQGEVIASGALESGSTAGLEPGSGCRLPFTIVDVPPAAAYTIDVGGAALRYTEAQLEERGWNVELRIGSVE